MTESFGLDRRIENCQGKGPIDLYRWDLDCLERVSGGHWTMGNNIRTSQAMIIKP